MLNELCRGRQWPSAMPVAALLPQHCRQPSSSSADSNKIFFACIALCMDMIALWASSRSQPHNKLGLPVSSAHAARSAGVAARSRPLRVLAQAAPERPSGGGSRLRILAQAAPERPAGGGARMPPGGASSFETPVSPSYGSAQPGADGRPSGGGARGSPTPASPAAEQAAPAAPAPARAAAAPVAPASTGGNVVVQVTSPPTSVSINGEVAVNGVLTPSQIYEKVGAAAGNWQGGEAHLPRSGAIAVCCEAQRTQLNDCWPGLQHQSGCKCLPERFVAGLMGWRFVAGGNWPGSIQQQVFVPLPTTNCRLPTLVPTRRSCPGGRSCCWALWRAATSAWVERCC